MERLTSREQRVSGIPGVCCAYFEGKDCQAVQGRCDDGCPWEEKAWDRLAAYEDTGLAPEEVTALQASNQELKKEALPLLQAKVQDRLVILPPIKIGDIAFFIIKNRIFEAKVYYMRWEHHKSFGIRGDISAECMGTCVGAPLFDFGKSVFLTREEAEAALKEQEG